MSFTYAAPWTGEMRRIGDGAPAPGVTVTIYLRGTSTKATLYTDRTKTTVLENPLPTGVSPNVPGLDTLGNAFCFADPGLYTGEASGTQFAVDIDVDPEEAVAGSGALGNGVVTDANVAPDAAIQETKLALAADAAAGTPSRRTLGTGAVQAAAGNHDHAGVYQPSDGDLAAIAALTTTVFGRAFLTLVDAAAALTYVGAQPSDSDLTAIAALTTTSFGRALLTLANAAALRSTAGITVATSSPGSPAVNDIWVDTT